MFGWAIFVATRTRERTSLCRHRIQNFGISGTRIVDEAIIVMLKRIARLISLCYRSSID